MDRKVGSTAVVTVEQIRAALNRGKFTATEENALRMRNGAKVALAAPLPTAYGEDEELGDELMLLEVRLLRALKHRKAQAVKVSAPRNATKSKIVATLKAKKK